MSHHREIEEVAYGLYEQSGKVDGRDLEHWLEAERIISARQAGKTAGSGAARSRAAVTKKNSPARSGKAAQKAPAASLS